MRQILIFGALLLLAVPAMAKDLYVQSAKAKLMAEPNFKSAAVTTVERGAKLEQVAEQNGWFQVKAGAATGWVNKLAVAANPPMDKVVVITADADQLQDTSRKRASAMTSAAAARGLSDAERKRMSDMGQADYRALGKLEDTAGAITDNDLRSFEAGN